MEKKKSVAKPVIITLVLLGSLAGAIYMGLQTFMGRLNSYAVWIEDLATGKQEKLTAGKGASVNPSFSRDGESVLFDSSTGKFGKGASRKLQQINLQDRTVKTLLDDGNVNIAPVFCGEDTVVYTSKRNGVFDIWKLKPSDGSVTRLTDDPMSEAEVKCSPDGQWLAFRQEDAKKFDQVFIMPVVENGVKRQLTYVSDFLHEVKNPAWSGDDEIIFLSLLRIKGVNKEGRETLSLLLEDLNNPAFPRVYPRNPGWLFLKARHAGSSSIRVNHYLVSRETGEVKILKENQSLLEMGYDFDADGTAVVYARP